MQADQATLDQDVPLSEVTFCVVDVETTGGSPGSAAITEVAALRYRGGERLETFHTLVDPRLPIPPFITHLTGIADRDVRGAPPIDAVAPTLAEFLAGGVFVAHNARFDYSLVNAALVRLAYDPVPPPPVCTARLARRVVWSDVPNVRLATLARYFRARRPEHRALPDAEACAEVFHGLLELGGRLGIHTLGDLHQASRARGRPRFAKIRLPDHLPRAPGVYAFRGDGGTWRGSVSAPGPCAPPPGSPPAPGRPGPLCRPLRRADHPGALRGARPEPRLLPLLAGRAPRSARGPDEPPGRDRRHEEAALLRDRIRGSEQEDRLPRR